MPLGQHLVELRKRVTRAALALVAGAVAGWFLFDAIWSAIERPIADITAAQPGARDVALNYTSITGAFDVRMQVAITAGIVLSSPVWLYQLFAFFFPALTRREKKYTFGFFFAIVLLFLAGVFAGWRVLPHVVEMMYSFVPADSVALYEAKYFLDFTLKLMIATGVAFVLPVFLVLLNFAGVVRGRSILKAWRVALLAITLFAAIATPAADVISMFLLALPMVMLYFGAVGISTWRDRVVDRRRAAELAF